MKQVSGRIPEEDYEELEEMHDEDEPFADVLREVISKGLEYDQLQSEIQELRTEIERLQNEKEQLIQDRERQQKLVARVDEQEEALQETLEWSRAGLFTRAKWRLFGKDE